MAQQTAVSFLLRELRIEDLAKGEQLSVVLHICEQAKQMEKEQIIKAHTRAYLIGEDTISIEDANIESEQYYNEIYGK